MEYTVSQLAALAGVSARTIRYYDSIGLLKPAAIKANGYRVYDTCQADVLQQILLYREMGLALAEIRAILLSPDYDRIGALEEQLTSLKQQDERIHRLIANVDKTLLSLKGDLTMSDAEKFEGMKRSAVDENDRKFGEEVKMKYGKEAYEASKSSVLGMNEQQWNAAQGLSAEINEELKAGLASGDPSGEHAQKACALHAQWLELMWGKGRYSKEAQLGLGQMYVCDGRFKAYYDSIADDAAEFFCEALKIYCAE